jgi:hypothetical protein
MFSVIQEIPTVGNATSVVFDVVPHSQPLVTGTRIGVVVVLDAR